MCAMEQVRNITEIKRKKRKKNESGLKPKMIRNC